MFLNEELVQREGIRFKFLSEVLSLIHEASSGLWCCPCAVGIYSSGFIWKQSWTAGVKCFFSMSDKLRPDCRANR